MSKRVFDVGSRFGRLVVLERLSPTLKSLCRCDCGVEKIVHDAHLTNGKTISCGCAKADRNRERALHGHAPRAGASRTYDCWKNMKGRCYVKSRPDFRYYGGRGITVCDRWRESYENFLADMGEVPEGLTLPPNCSARWVNHSVPRSTGRRCCDIRALPRTLMVADGELYPAQPFRRLP